MFNPAILKMLTCVACILPIWMPAAGAQSGLAVDAGHLFSSSLPDSPNAHRSDSELPDSPSTLPAQSSTTAPTGETEAERAAREKREEAARELKEEERQRIGGVVPNFNVVMNGQAAPLSASQKFNLAFHSIIDPANVALAVLAGGYGELSDDHTGYGHGPGGYFKRVGAAYADTADGTLIGNAILPSILHQDPRYYRRGEGSVKSRILYSAMTAIICHGDNGKRQFNTSNVLGNFIAGGISNAYYPSDERGVELTIENASLVTAEGMLGAQLLEFSPDVTGYLQRRMQARRARKAAKDSSSTLP